MLFNSLAFAIFLPIVFFLYWALPSKYRSFFLLIVSYYFYMSWNVKYVVLILFTTVLSYGCARLLEKYPAVFMADGRSMHERFVFFQILQFL